MNGHFDVAMYLLEKGANPNLAAENGVAPLYAALNCQWAPQAAVPAAARVPPAADVAPEDAGSAARQGRRSQRATEEEGLVFRLHAGQFRRRRGRRHAPSGGPRTPTMSKPCGSCSRAAPTRTSRRWPGGGGRRRTRWFGAGAAAGRRTGHDATPRRDRRRVPAELRGQRPPHPSRRLDARQSDISSRSSGPT